jgi:hypothetical protein
VQVRRVLTFLAARDMLITDPARQSEPRQHAVDRLRQDRILGEARHTADPVHLVRVFGITENTAIYYGHAAHPGRQSVIPRQ